MDVAVTRLRIVAFGVQVVRNRRFQRIQTRLCTEQLARSSTTRARCTACQSVLCRTRSGIHIELNGDAFATLRRNINATALSIDKPTAALLTDLKQRGLLDGTLELWRPMSTAMWFVISWFKGRLEPFYALLYV
ncbi:MAG TPA: hypothetical protein DHW22_08975 [Planctomycetaceae bacterium]|nr:hypothetical protein [Planctomycetaceae bacterium]